MLTSAGLGGALTTYAYDFAGRLDTEGERFVAAGPTFNVTYGYDRSGLRTRVTWPDGWDATYADAKRQSLGVAIWAEESVTA
ncbi:MAG: hypothetical protein WDM79_14890 [Terricaulis sp.]